MWHAWERKDMYTKLWFENLKERGNLEDLGTDKRIM
jgi:hypothetical protein